MVSDTVTDARGQAMQRQSLYIAARLGGPFLAAALCLTAVVWLTQSLRFVDMIVNHGLPFSTFVLLTTLTLPSVLAIILPVAAFVATVAVYRRMIADSELVALRATGSSNARLAAPAVALGALVALAVLAINLYAMPAGQRAFKDRQYELRHSLASTLLREGVFNTPLDGVTIFVRERAGGGALRGILVHDERDPAEPATVVAERGALLDTPQGPRFVLENGSRQHVDRADGRASFLLFDSYAFDVASGKPAPERSRKAGERYIHELLRPEDAVGERGRREFLAEAWHRAVSPFYAVVLALTACAGLLAGEFDRHRQQWRVVAIAASGAAFMAAAMGLRNAMAAAPWLAGVYCLAVVACGVVAARLLIAEPRRRGGGARPARAG